MLYLDYKASVPLISNDTSVCAEISKCQDSEKLMIKL